MIAHAVYPRKWCIMVEDDHRGGTRGNQGRRGRDPSPRLAHTRALHGLIDTELERSLAREHGLSVVEFTVLDA